LSGGPGASSDAPGSSFSAHGQSALKGRHSIAQGNAEGGALGYGELTTHWAAL